MKVYLAGKMDENGSWRDALIGSVYDYKARRSHPRWEVVTEITSDYDYEDLRLPAWPEEENTYVLGLHDYVGPYRFTYGNVKPESKHAGYFHGSTARGQHGMMDDRLQRQIVLECIVAIRRADFVFVYINRPDCFGTIAEAAFARSAGKYVHMVVNTEACWSWQDYWFVGEMANAFQEVSFGCQKTESEMVAEHFRDAIVTWTARPVVQTPLSLVATPYGEVTDVREYVQSFSQIARWSADPRVRTEAQRMLRRITG